MAAKILSKSQQGSLRSMLKVDFRRMFTMPLVYIMTGICLFMPILILIMTTSMATTTIDPITGVETSVETFTNVWQSIGSLSSDQSSMSMDLTSICNINLLYFFITILVCIFIADDFRSGYSKNLFTVRAKKTDYVISKTLVGFVGGILMIIAYFIGAMIGGAIAKLPFTVEGVTISGVLFCMIAKVFLIFVFVAINVLAASVAKQKLWLSMICSFAASMLLFTMIPMMTPLDATFFHVILCLAGGILFSIGLGSISNLILKKTNLV